IVSVCLRKAPPPTNSFTLSLHDALPIYGGGARLHGLLALVELLAALADRVEQVVEAAAPGEQVARHERGLRDGVRRLRLALGVRHAVPAPEPEHHHLEGEPEEHESLDHAHGFLRARSSRRTAAARSPATRL